MRKAASIFLRACERRRDLDSLIYWLKNPEVTRFLNEEPGVAHYLSRLADTMPEPMLSSHRAAVSGCCEGSAQRACTVDYNPKVYINKPRLLRKPHLTRAGF